jgi:hypothetical protein
MDLPERYKKLIAVGIDSSANLPDLNDMTDRSQYALKPWTAKKTVGTIDLIKRHGIVDEETFVEKFQSESLIRLEVLTDQVYEHQMNFFGRYKYDKDTIFKYTYCCVVVNSLQGNNTERKFDNWANSKGISLKEPNPLLDQKFHTDRLHLDGVGKVCAFISIKPNSFSHNYLQYTDVFAGLQVLTHITGIPWKIYYRDGDVFNLIQLGDLSDVNQNAIKNWANGYSKDEINEIIPILDELKK